MNRFEYTHRFYIKHTKNSLFRKFGESQIVKVFLSLIKCEIVMQNHAFLTQFFTRSHANLSHPPLSQRIRYQLDLYRNYVLGQDKDIFFFVF